MNKDEMLQKTDKYIVDFKKLQQLEYPHLISKIVFKFVYTLNLDTTNYARTTINENGEDETYCMNNSCCDKSSYKNGSYIVKIFSKLGNNLTPITSKEENNEIRKKIKDILKGENIEEIEIDNKNIDYYIKKETNNIFIKTIETIKEYIYNN